MITLVIMAIALSLGVPSLQSFIKRNATVGESMELMADLNMARAEAIRRSLNVSVAAIGGSWNQGWMIVVDNDLDGGADAGTTTLNQSDAAKTGFNWVGPVGANYVSFGATGQMLVNGATVLVPQQFAVCGPDGATNPDQARRVVLSVSGHAEMRKGGGGAC